MSIRPEVERLVALGPMPDDRETPTPPVEAVTRYQEAIEALPHPLSEEEAIALLDVFPQTEEGGGLFGLEWSLLHAIETAPYGSELLASLDDRSWWVTNLRSRAERGGLR